jgi:ribosomal protein S18 acetylase RimI-like enzyme
MAFLFSNPHISIARPADITTITSLLNSAYRGEGSKQGWTTEAHLIAGDARTDENQLQQIMQSPNSIFAIFTNEQKEVTGCVNLQLFDNKMYLGMFSVAPKLQGFGIGKQLLKAAEEYARHLQCSVIFMTVISARVELIDWYKRFDYKDTGERRHFEEDGLSGKHMQPLEFMVLEKEI